MILLAQASAPVPSWLEHGVTMAVVAFAGYGLAWISIRMFGTKGIITLANERNTATMERQEHTLVELKDLAGAQQGLCTRHAVALEGMEGVKGNAESAAVNSKAMADQWANENHNEYRVVPVLDAILKSVDTAEEMSKKCGCDFAAEIKVLRTEIIAIKDKIQQG